MSSSSDQHAEAYRRKRPTYEAWSETLCELMRTLLRSKEVDYVTVEARAKTVESFMDKIEREDKSYDDPIEEVTDLTGLRVITYQLADIDSVSELIRANFDVDQDNSTDKSAILDADRFGYLSVHFVVSLNDKRSRLPEYNTFGGLKAEIQVRTVLQHAWAAIDHKLRYKRQEEIPRTSRRKLFRISALLETADSEFESLRRDLAETRNAYSKDIKEENFEIDLDLDSLTAYIGDGKLPKQLLEAASSTGCVLGPHSPNSSRPEYSLLLSMLQELEIDSIQGFEQMVKGLAKGFPGLVREINAKWKETVDSDQLRLVLPSETVFRIAVFFSQTPDSLDSIVPTFKFGAKLRSAIQYVYSARHPDSNLVLPAK